MGVVEFRPFDTTGRERFVAKMNQVGYVEMEAFRGHEDYLHYCCLSCPAMMKDERSPTGWWCQLVQIPDAPHGCCNRWYAFPEVIERQK